MKWPFIVARDKFQKTLGCNRYTPYKTFLYLYYLYLYTFSRDPHYAIAIL